MTDWIEELGSLLSSYFSDWSVEEGVEQLVSVSAYHPDYHKYFTDTLHSAIEAVDRGDERIVAVVNGYYLVNGLDDVRKFIEEILGEYQRQYAIEVHSNDA